MEIIGQVYGKEEAAKAKISEMDTEIAAIVDKLPQEKKKIAISYTEKDSENA